MGLRQRLGRGVQLRGLELERGQHERAIVADGFGLHLVHQLEHRLDRRLDREVPAVSIASHRTAHGIAWHRAWHRMAPRMAPRIGTAHCQEYHPRRAIQGWESGPRL